MVTLVWQSGWFWSVFPLQSSRLRSAALDSRYAKVIVSVIGRFSREQHHLI